MPSALQFFIPTYAIPDNDFRKAILDKLVNWFNSEYPKEKKILMEFEQLLSGHLKALADYRTLKASDMPNKLPYLHTFSESNFGNPIEQFEFDGKKFSCSSLNYILGICFLKQYLKFLLGFIPNSISGLLISS